MHNFGRYCRCQREDAYYKRELISMGIPPVVTNGVRVECYYQRQMTMWLITVWQVTSRCNQRETYIDGSQWNWTINDLLISRSTWNVTTESVTARCTRTLIFCLNEIDTCDKIHSTAASSATEEFTHTIAGRCLRWEIRWHMQSVLRLFVFLFFVGRGPAYSVLQRWEHLNRFTAVKAARYKCSYIYTHCTRGVDRCVWCERYVGWRRESRLEQLVRYF